MFFLLIELLIFVFFKNWEKYLYISLTILNVIVLLYIEHLDIGFISTPPNDITLKIDLGISFFLFSLGVYMIMQLALKEYIAQKSRWENIFQAIGQPAFVLSPDQRLIEVNEATIKASGQKKEELIGMYCYQLFHKPNSTAPPKECPLLK